MVPSRTVEEHLRRADRWWKWLLLVRRFSIVTIASLLCVVLLGWAMYGGWFQTALGPSLVLMLIAAGTAFSAAGVLMVTLERRADNALLASALERSHQPLLDRLNTLVHLQQQGSGRAESLQPLIEQQATAVLRDLRAGCPFPGHPAWLHVGAAGASLLLTVLFFAYFQPWNHVKRVPPPQPVASGEPDLELPPETSAPEGDDTDPLNQQAWTDVRISEPGKDLTVTEHEVVPLRIEAASNRTLTRVEWFSSTNGSPPRTHELPAPEDPRYVAYQRQLLLEDYELEPWDVVSYFARATTEDGQTHDSPIYFIELVPYREQLEKLPGGDEGPALEQLEQVTDLLERQREVIRQTRHAAATQGPGKENKARGGRLEQLAREESQLERDVKLFDAALRGRMDVERLQPLDQPVQRSQSALQSAEQQLRNRAAGEALEHERQALSALVALRKELQRLAAEHPEGFQTDPLEQLASTGNNEQQPSQQAEQQAGQLQQMQTRQDALAAARELVQSTLQQQRDLQRSVNPRRGGQLPDQARRQLELQQSLEDHIEQNPQPFAACQQQGKSASSAMRQAAQSMQQQAPDARRRAAEAADSLQKLDDALDQQQQRNQLADAMRLERMLDQQMRRLDQFEQKPESVSPSQCRNVGGQAKSLADQLQKMAGGRGPGSALGPELQEALQGDAKQQVEAAGDRLAESQTPRETQTASRQLREQLEPLAESLRQSLGQPANPAPGGSLAEGAREALRPEGREAIERGIRQLESISRRQAMRRSSEQAQTRLSREAARNLFDGISGLYGHNEQTQVVLQRIGDQLREQAAPVDPETIRELMQQMQAVRREAAPEATAPRDPTELLGGDPESVSPEYRDWARKYFEELSRRQ